MEFAFSSSIDIDPGKTLFWQLRVVLNPLQMLASCRQAAAPVSIAAASDIMCVSVSFDGCNRVVVDVG